MEGVVLVAVLVVASALGGATYWLAARRFGPATSLAFALFVFGLLSVVAPRLFAAVGGR